jgi:hypothetical protein
VRLFFLENVIVNEATNFVCQPQSPGQEIALMHSYEVEVYIDNFNLKQNYQSRIPGFASTT